MKFHALVLLGGSCCGLAYAAAPDAATPSVETTLTPIVVGEIAGPHASSFAPLVYFNANCARCHGENGSFYEKDFAKNKSDADLREVIDEMAEGPAQSPLAPAELDAVAAWHRALRDKKPFVVLVKSEKIANGWKLSGEISPGATLQINEKEVEVKGSSWATEVAVNTVQLRATKGEVITQLDANLAAWAP